MTNSSIFDVLRILENAKVSFHIARDRPDTIRVDATFYGLRVEIECFEDNHIEISTFKGDEDIEGGYEYLLKIITDNALD